MRGDTLDHRPHVVDLALVWFVGIAQLNTIASLKTCPVLHPLEFLRVIELTHQPVPFLGPQILVLIKIFSDLFGKALFGLRAIE
jgi:hypothetical protein